LLKGKRIMKKIIIYVIAFIALFSTSASANPCGLLTDINGDNRIGTEEAIYALQMIAEIRSGDITLRDALCALRTLAGIEDHSYLTVKNYIGTWQGNGKFENHRWTGTVTLELSLEGDALTGTVTFEGGQPFEISEPLTNGKLIFPLPNYDPDTPECANWDVTITTAVDSTLKSMNLKTAGTFCGRDGGEHDTLSAILVKTNQDAQSRKRGISWQTPADSIPIVQGQGLHRNR